jgi:hypothetical protein
MTGGPPCVRRRAPSTVWRIARQEHQDWVFRFQTSAPFDASIVRQEYQTTRFVPVSTRQKFPGGRLRGPARRHCAPLTVHGIERQEGQAEHFCFPEVARLETPVADQDYQTARWRPAVADRMMQASNEESGENHGDVPLPMPLAHC